MPAHATKRLALAKALVLDAPLTILDEIEVGLDQEHAESVVDAILKFRQRTNGTMLITTHNIDLASQVADNLAVMVNGRIVASGPASDLLRGIKSSEDLDRAFQFSEFAPPDQMGADEAERLREGRDEGGAWRSDSGALTVGIAIVTILLLMALFVAARSHVG